MRVTLVHPAGYNFQPGQPDFTVLANRMAPIGIMQMSSWLEKHGHSVALQDALGPKAPPSLEENLELILKTNPDMVGFSTTTSAFLNGYDLATMIKERRPDVKIVFGNAHVSAVGAPLLKWFPNIDYLCMGEGEGCMLDLADGKPMKEVANLVWRDGEKLVVNPRRPRIGNLDELPFPSYEKLLGFPSGYHLPPFSYEQRWGATMITSRGCPFTCSFCDRTVFEGKYKHQSKEYIHEHFKYLRDRFGVHHINIYDDLFTASRKRLVDLLEHLAAKPLGMQFNCAVRAGDLDPDLLKLLKAAGCLQVSMGVESADEGMMEKHKAGITLPEVRNTVKMIHEAGLRAKCLFIFGLQGETPKTIEATSQFINSLDLDEMNMTKFTPFHGAPSWNECISGADGTFHEDWRLMNCLNFVYKPHGFDSVEQMEKQYNQVVTSFYRSRGYQQRFKKNIWKHKWTIWHMIKNAYGFFQAYRHFKPDSAHLDEKYTWPELHPAQPAHQLPPAKSNDPVRRFAGAKWQAISRPAPTAALAANAAAAAPAAAGDHGHDHPHPH
jgi:radical SAM superfamily enzyme YgiQ (UPF0313 family)